MKQFPAQDLGSVIMQSMEKGFLKSGMGINKLIHFNYADVGYLGLGLSVFYSYAYHQLPAKKDNPAFRLNISFSF